MIPGRDAVSARALRPLCRLRPGADRGRSVRRDPTARVRSTRNFFPSSGGISNSLRIESHQEGGRCGHEEISGIEICSAPVQYLPGLQKKNWGGKRESNPQPSEPQSGALPVELFPPQPSDYSNCISGTDRARARGLRIQTLGAEVARSADCVRRDRSLRIRIPGPANALSRAGSWCRQLQAFSTDV